MTARLIVVNSVIVVAIATLARSAQLDPERSLKQARALYHQGLFDEAIAVLNDEIDEIERLRELEEKRMELAEAHFLLGLSYVAIRADASAKENFVRAATFDPARVLHPDVYAPKVIVLYEEAQRLSSFTVEPKFDETESPEEESGHVASGTRVRARFEGWETAVVGSLVSIDQDTLTLITEQFQTITLPRADITTLEISTGRNGHALWGALIGAGAGALIGLAEGADDCVGDGCYTRGENIGYGALGAGLVGALVGALYRTDQWVPVSTTGVQIGVNVRPRGAGVAVKFSF